MSGQHTPGPWLLKATPWPWGFYPATAYDVVVEEGCGNEGFEYESQTEIASIHNAAVGGKDHHPSASEAEANARLIVAAPDGLELAQDAIPILEVLLEEREEAIGEECEILRDLLARTRAFLAKARGGAA